MGRFKVQNLRYTPYHLWMYQEQGLKVGIPRELHSYLWNHCQNLNKGGWCGLSNANLAEELQTSSRTVERAIQELKEKNFIELENEGTKFRKIFISDFHYKARPEQADVADQRELEEKNRRIAELEEQIKQLNSVLSNQTPQANVNFVGMDLIKSGFISKEDYSSECEELNALLMAFLIDCGNDRGLASKYFRRWRKYKKGKINSYAAYVNKSIYDVKLEWQLQNGLNNLGES